MKNYTITVNGKAYNVTVEEGHKEASQAAPEQASIPAPKPAAPKTVTAPAPQKTAEQVSGASGSAKITASVPGKITKIEASAGQSVKKGDSVVVLEAMKMEIPITAPADGTIAGITVSVGDAVESGDVLATMD
mgnify:CR=1 FL=1